MYVLAYEWADSWNANTHHTRGMNLTGPSGEIWVLLEQHFV